MEKSNITQDPVRFAHLTKKYMDMVRKGERTFEDLEWFLNLSQKNLAELQKRKAPDTRKSLLAEIASVFNEVSSNNNWIDGDIKEWFDAETVDAESSIVANETKVHRFTKSISHRNIIDERKKAGNLSRVHLTTRFTQSY